MNSVWSKEELPQQWKESIIALLYKKFDEVTIESHDSSGGIVLGYGLDDQGSRV
jgi:hypothetical protein